MLVYSHNDCLLKNNGPNHPERKERLKSILDSIKDIKDFKIDFKEAPIAKIDTISLVHPKEHIEEIFSLIPKDGLQGVEKEPYADTMLCPNSKNAILRSCGAGVAAADSLIKENKKKIFCAVRPPGHHAETVRANGFCFINNVAVVARYLQKNIKLTKLQLLILMFIMEMEHKRSFIKMKQ